VYARAYGLALSRRSLSPPAAARRSS
jgi:hypothetical protein